ncbi:hypothetical protein [Sphingobacterium paucimobilis]|uniref:Outer membrane protein beta-barrel domain-containing protein n=1 Tax=Sphingobacterium paucimobilis HER1398 TaxID=1346330 RepID=U2HWX1_9SPHI|nr:hypothetical protein [Sphingobacterium paucimobilis]ERJ59770.1 hypothetical protein M472_13415 [Sphingobacterium paucimobilis HER1398]
MWRAIFAVVFVFVIITVRAQPGCPPPFGVQNELKKYHIAAGVGLTHLYGDIHKAGTLGKALFIKGDYQIKRGLYAGVEGQFGILEAMEDNILANSNRYAKNSYMAGGLMVTFHPFEFFALGNGFQTSALDVLKNSFYVGVGVLGIMNNYKDDVFRDEGYYLLDYKGPVPPGNYGPIDHYNEKGIPVFKKKINSVTIPTVNIGFAVPVNRRYSKSGNYWSVLVNGQFNFANNDLLDGYMPYDDQFRRIGTKNDMYTMYSLGARYSF